MHILQGGLSKLAGAAATVDTLSNETQQQRAQLKASQVQSHEGSSNHSLTVCLDADTIYTYFKILLQIHLLLGLSPAPIMWTVFA